MEKRRINQFPTEIDGSFSIYFTIVMVRLFEKKKRISGQPHEETDNGSHQMTYNLKSLNMYSTIIQF